MNSQPTDGSATHRTYVMLRDMIVKGKFAPGEKLKIDSLRQRLETGASPIREALSLLTSDNLVERMDQRGFVAAKVSVANFEEILRLRCSLEDQALRQSIANASEIWEESIVLAHHRMRRVRGTTLDAFEARHKDFHMSLLSNAGSPILQKYCSQLYDLNIRYRFLAGNALNYRERNVDDEHAEILEATIARDAETASACLLSHYQKTGEFLSGLLDIGTVA